MSVFFEDCENCMIKNNELRQGLQAEREKVKELEQGVSNVNRKYRETLKYERKYKQALEPFEDEYFKGLNTKQIAELAKKSIRLTTENRKLEAALDEIEEITKLSNMLPTTTSMQYGLIRILDIIRKAKGKVK